MKKKLGLSTVLSGLVVALMGVAAVIFCTGKNSAMDRAGDAWAYVVSGDVWLTLAMVTGLALAIAVTSVSVIKKHYQGIFTGICLVVFTFFAAFALGFKENVLAGLGNIKADNQQKVTLITTLASTALGVAILSGVLAILEPTVFVKEEVVEEKKQEQVIYNVTNYITPAHYEKPTEEVRIETVPVTELEEPVEEVKKPMPRRIPFAVKMKASSRDLKDKYDELRDYIMSYGFKSRISIDGDTFKINGTRMIQITVTGNKMKVYFALDPYDYITSPLPVKVAYAKKYKDLKAELDVKSDLSVRRAKDLVDLIVAKAQTQVAE